VTGKGIWNKVVSGTFEEPAKLSDARRTCERVKWQLAENPGVGLNVVDCENLSDAEKAPVLQKEPVFMTNAEGMHDIERVNLCEAEQTLEELN
jgi:hypothetical protein